VTELPHALTAARMRQAVQQLLQVTQITVGEETELVIPGDA
jgi:hypothetical protein